MKHRAFLEALHPPSEAEREAHAASLERQEAEAERQEAIARMAAVQSMSTVQGDAEPRISSPSNSDEEVIDTEAEPEDEGQRFLKELFG